MTSMRWMVAIAIVAALALPVAAQQQAADQASHHGAAPQSVAQAAPLAEGEVRRVDKEAKKLTIRHGLVPNIDMPEMTMVFQVKDPAMLDQVKVGDKIKFQAEKIDGAYTVTRIEAVR